MATITTAAFSYNGDMQGEKFLRNNPRRVSPAAISSDSSRESAITRSSIASSFSSPPCSPSPSTPSSSVNAALDQYVAASTEGRESFTHGDLQSAVKDFNHALAIELQTELDCLYDTSIGFMSGLVRSEVNARLQQHHWRDTDSVKCSRILRQLRDTFYKAADGLGKKHTEAKWYLQMGAALVMINEWEKAKAVYTEGINVCKDRKALKHALKNLIKIEQMTSYAEIPPEDQPDNYLNTYPPSCSPRHSPRPSPRHSPRPSPQPSPDPSPSQSPAISPRRDRSKSVAMRQKKLRTQRDRTTSLSLERELKLEDLGRNSDNALTNSPMRSSPMTKRSSFGGLFNSRRVTLLSPDITTAWSSCFDPASCKVTSQTEYQVSAISHMRTLSALDNDPDAGEDSNDNDDNDSGSRSSHDEPLNGSRSGRFNAVNFRSLKIEDDDSELDDTD